MAIQTQNPATGEVLEIFEPHDDAFVDSAIAKSVEAQKEVTNWSFDKRRTYMEKMASILDEEADDFAKIITLEMGKPYQQAIGEVKKMCLGLPLLC